MTHKRKFFIGFFLIIGVCALILQCKKDDAKLTPSITALAPSTGPFGASVTISGNNFSTLITNNTVNFNGAEAIVSAATKSQLIVIVPSGAVSGKVNVTVEGLTGISPGNFVVDNTPMITSFSPASGIIASTVSISGTNFSTIAANNIVSFAGVTGTVTAATATQIAVTVPNGTKTGKITVSVNGLAATSSSNFTLSPPTITGISPTSGLKWAQVTLTGTGFDALVAHDSVFFNGKAAVVLSATNTQIVAKVSSNSGSGPVSIKMDGTQSSGPVFTFLDGSPTITGFLPPTATIASTITINGTNFSSIPENNFVGFGAAIGKVTSATATQITVVIPNGAVSGPISLSVNELKTTSANSFTLTPPTITSMSPNSGPKWTEVTLTGTGFDALNTNDSVFFNGIAGIIVSTTNTKIIAKVSPNSGTGPVTLRMDGTQCTGPVFTCLLSATVVVTTVAGTGSSGSSNGTGTSASFNDPNSLAIDSTGNVIISDAHNNMIRKMTPAGVVTTIAGSTSIGATNATGTAASFNVPTAVTLDVTGNIYVADAINQLIRKIAPGGIVSTYAGSGSPGANNGAASTATFNIPHGVAVDLSGNVYVADNENDLIRKITPDGTVSTFAGQSGTPGASNGTGTAASFNNPWALTVDRFGNVYVADTFNHLIRKITPGGLVTTVAGSGTQGNTDGTGTAASFNTPTGIAVDYAGNLYVADFDNSLIRKITPGGVVSTLAGTRGVTGSADGVSSLATFNHPYGLCVTASGKVVYVADAVNDLIRKITVE